MVGATSQECQIVAHEGTVGDLFEYVTEIAKCLLTRAYPEEKQQESAVQVLKRGLGTGAASWLRTYVAYEDVMISQPNLCFCRCRRESDFANHVNLGQGPRDPLT